MSPLTQINMNKIIILQGPPACGKSYKARELHNEDKNRVIICRDDIRNMRGDYWIPGQEEYISKIEEFAIRTALEQGLTPIIDATNLNPKTIKKWEIIANEYNADIDYIKCIVPMEVAIERDVARGNKVGEAVIRNFYETYKDVL